MYSYKCPAEDLTLVADLLLYKLLKELRSALMDVACTFWVFFRLRLTTANSPAVMNTDMMKIMSRANMSTERGTVLYGVS